MSAGNIPIGMIQKGPACSSPSVHCCDRHNAAGETKRVGSFPRYRHLSQETQHIDSAQYGYGPVLYKWDTLAVLSLYGNSDKACISLRTHRLLKVCTVQ